MRRSWHAWHGAEAAPAVTTRHRLLPASGPSLLRGSFGPLVPGRIEQRQELRRLRRFGYDVEGRHGLELRTRRRTQVLHPPRRRQHPAVERADRLVVRLHGAQQRFAERVEMLGEGADAPVELAA